MAWFFLFLSVVLLRGALAHHWALAPSAIWDNGIVLGIYFDFVALLLPVAFSYLSQFSFRRRFPGWFLGASCLWLAAFSNLLNVRFFDEPLDWLTLQTGFINLFAIRGAVFSLSLSWDVFLSFTLFLIAVVLAFRTMRDPWTSRAKALRRSLVLLLCFLFLRQAVTAFGWDKPFSMGLLSHWVLKDWYDGFRSHRRATGPCELELDRAESAKKTLARYAAGNLNSSRSYEYFFAPDKADVFTLRQRLGFASDAKLNAIVLFVESLRGYEFFHPKLGQRTFPKTRELFRKHGILFSQAYSSAKLTVNGEYVALCSSLPPFFTTTGIYDINQRFPVRCLQGMLRDLGYETFYFNTYHSEFCSTKAWERNHGTETFLDYGYFKRLGLTEKVGQWGLADRPFLLNTLKYLESISPRKSFFANVLTMSSHAPFAPVPGFSPHPDSEAHLNPGEHAGMVSTYQYVDSALADFLEAFLRSPLADNTVLLFSSDHSLGHPEPPKLNPVQQIELRSRIVLGLFSKRLRSPNVSARPVNQLDIAPTLATALNIQGQTAWLGRSLFDKHTTPWVQPSPRGISFRQENLACYDVSAACFKLGTQDPLFDRLETSTLSADRPFYQAVTTASDELIRHGCAMQGR